MLFDYCPDEYQWWITGFDPSHQNAQANNLHATITIDFSDNMEMGKAFKASPETNDWIFEGTTATLEW